MMRRNVFSSFLHIYTVSFYMSFLVISSCYGSQVPYAALPSASSASASQVTVKIKQKTTKVKIVPPASHGDLNNSFSSSSSDDSPASSSTGPAQVFVDQNGINNKVAAPSVILDKGKSSTCCTTKVVGVAIGSLLCLSISAVLYIQVRITEQAQGIGSSVEQLGGTGDQLAQSTAQIAYDVQGVYALIKSLINITRSNT